MAKIIIGVMGPGANPAERDLDDAKEIGKQIARNDWMLLTGGRAAGVMHAASEGAANEGGLVIGVLPGGSRNGMSPFVDIPIATGMGSARNNINVLSSDIVIACGTGAGTTSEIMLTLKAQKPVILLNQTAEARHFLESMDSSLIHFADSPNQAIQLVKKLV